MDTDPPLPCQGSPVLASPPWRRSLDGGVFVKSKDKTALRAWYRDMLGLDISDWGGAQFESEPGSTTQWSSFPEDSDYFQGAFMINFRVDDAEALAAALKAKGANVLDRSDDSEFGEFRYAVDPDGTLLELWQPAT
jgi:predicted enzyme related to lactoylglutathione lyase